jgi:hypothetical protein
MAPEGGLPDFPFSAPWQLLANISHTTRTLNPISTLAASHSKQGILEMKPIALITSTGMRRDSFDRALSKRRRQPFTDYAYYSGAFEQ